MDLLRLLSLSAIVLSVSACILVYFSHRRTAARLEALTQANVGITQTIHKLVAYNMNQQNENSEQTDILTNNTSSDNKNNLEVAERIVVSDDESESDSDSSDDSDVVSDADSLSDDSDDEHVDNDVDDVEDDANVHMVSLRIKNEEDKDEDEGDEDEGDEDDDEDEDEDEDEDDDNNEDEDEDDNDDNLITPTNTENTNDTNDNENNVEIDDVKEVENNENIIVNKEDHDDIETIELDDSNRIKNDVSNLISMNNMDIEQSLAVQELTDMLIEPIKNSGAAFSVSVSLTGSGSNNLTADTLRQFKVEELRKMAIDNLKISEEEAKKMKKAKLIEKLTE